MMDDDNFMLNGSLVCLDDADSSDTAWIEILQQPAENEVVIEAGSPCQDTDSCSLSLQLPGTETGLDLDSLVEQSTHKTHAMQTLTELIGHDTQTSVEHVSEIINHESGSVATRKAIGVPQVHQRSPSVLTHRKPRNVIKKVIIMQPGDDAEQVTADAINEITADLNQKAADRIAQGENPDKETVIEITRINTPISGPGIKNHGIPALAQACPANQSDVLPQPQSPQRQSPISPAERKHHRRKSPHPKRYMYHTPSPPQSKSRHSRTAHSLNANCYFESRPRAGPSTTHHTTASSKLLGLTARPLTPVATNTDQTTVPHSHTASAKLQSVLHQSKPSILRNMRQASDVHCSGQSGQVLGHDTMVCPSSVNVHLTNYVNISQSAGADRTTPVPSQQVCDRTNQEAKPQVPGSGSKLNESLTNIQWLGTMSGDPLDGVHNLPHKDARVIATDRQIDMVSQECGRKKRPPYSYMHLIQMAICSSEEKRMTLKEIYQWIEEKFPFYKFCPNQGWKNSIRHNLSLYDIFVREKMLTARGKAGSSYWTLRPDVPVKTVRAIQNLASGHSSLTSEYSTYNSNSSFGAASFKVMNSSNSMSPSLTTTATCHYRENSPSLPPQGTTSSSKKKGPVPLLPKPPAMQTYALIPIQAGVPVVPQQPIMVSSLTPTTTKASVHSGPSKVTARIRPASATEFLKGSRSHLSGEQQDDVGNRGRRPGSAFELMRSSSIPSSGAEVSSSAQRSAMPSLDLLSGIEIRPEGMSTPPPQYSAGMKDGSQEKYALKRSMSFTPEYGGPSRKLANVSLKASHAYPNDHSSNKVKKSAVITRCKTQRCEHVEENSSMEASAIHSRTSHVRFADSGFISDSSANDQTVDTSGLPKPIMYMSVSKTEKDDCYILTRTPSDCSSVAKSTLLSVDCSTEAGLHDILSSIEKSLSSPMRNLLRTPPKSAEKNLFTSTPFKVAFESPSWMSPIKGLTPIAGDPSLEGTLFTPVKDAKAVTSTPTYKVESAPQSRDTRTPPDENQKELQMFSFPSLTPLKTPFKSPASKDPKPSCSSERSPNGAFANQSFSKFLGEFPFESMIDEGINMDVSNMSFSAFQ